MWSRTELETGFRHAGVEPGDTVHVHSSLRKLGPVEGGADTIIDALIAAVGPGGTVSVPTHTFAVVHHRQPVYHVDLTPSNVGTLPNVFRTRPRAVRGLHPTHSVAAIGSRAHELVAGQEECDTPCPSKGAYGKLRDWGGKVVIIGVGLECCTLFHGCEEWSGVPWAFSKETCRLYSITSECTVIPISLHVHKVNTWDQYPRLEPELLKEGILRVETIGSCELRVIDATSAAEWLIERLKHDPRIVLPDDFSPERWRG